MVSLLAPPTALVVVGGRRKRQTLEGGASMAPTRLHLHLAAVGLAGSADGLTCQGVPPWPSLTPVGSDPPWY